MEQEVMAIAEQVTALITVYGLKVIGAVAFSSLAGSPPNGF
tara:strand:+ start:173 stop:295 length:123 start_codon:yes stop_codon:yes gene_type:complete